MGSEPRPTQGVFARRTVELLRRSWPGVWAGPPGPAGGAGSISQRCCAWPLASFHASLLFQCKSEATQVLHLTYRVSMEIKAALESCGREGNQQGTKHQVILLPHQRSPRRLQGGCSSLHLMADRSCSFLNDASFVVCLVSVHHRR